MNLVLSANLSLLGLQATCNFNFIPAEILKII
jgi:hypothetical protein